ncbi:MurG-like transferase [Rosistilla oblonga]|nr:UDP-2,4-diacetamido-2,4,6-trideoxy-beta-L-altropyranose hydrolase [Rosistilla oblonga]QDV11926.1 MurG-like transferase [Rosistilla oblonga]
MRSLAIAQAWQDRGGEVTFASSELPDALKSRIAAEGFRLISVTDPPGSSEDARRLLAVADRMRAAAIVLDGYTYGADYHAAIGRSKHSTLAIDDCSHLAHYSTDFVLNQNADVAESRYPNLSPQTQLLLGTSYALLRRELVDAFDTVRDEPTGKRILVTLGGSDPDNVTSAIIKALRSDSDSDLSVRVIVGAMNSHVDSLKQAIGGDARIEILQDVAAMSHQYRWADLAIAAGGSSNWEMCYYGLPRIVLVIADNQIEIAAALQRKQIAVNLGPAADVEPSDVKAAVNAMLNNPAKLQVARAEALKLVDGKGAWRCVDRLLKHNKPMNLYPS